MPTLQAAHDNRIVEDDLDWSEHDNCAHIPNARLLKSLEDVEAGRGLRGPFATAAEAMAALMKEVEELDDEEDAFCTL